VLFGAPCVGGFASLARQDDPPPPVILPLPIVPSGQYLKAQADSDITLTSSDQCVGYNVYIPNSAESIASASDRSPTATLRNCGYCLVLGSLDSSPLTVRLDGTTDYDSIKAPLEVPGCRLESGFALSIRDATFRPPSTIRVSTGINSTFDRSTLLTINSPPATSSWSMVKETMRIQEAIGRNATKPADAALLSVARDCEIPKQPFNPETDAVVLAIVTPEAHFIFVSKARQAIRFNGFEKDGMTIAQTTDLAEGMWAKYDLTSNKWTSHATMPKINDGSVTIPMYNALNTIGGETGFCFTTPR